MPPSDVSDRFKILFVGDIVGATGLRTAIDNILTIRDELSIDCIVVNGENVTDGKGITRGECDQLFEAGVSVISTGNHIWERWGTRGLLYEERRLLRPLNYPKENPGAGYAVVDVRGTAVGVLNIQGRTFLPSIDCPFHTADWALPRIERETPIILVDFHAEATAEKMAMGWYLDGRVSAVLGTHTHVQTSDGRILPKGTAFLTDVGMTGSYAGVVGMRADIALKRFLLQTAHKFELAEGDQRFSAAVVTVNRTTGTAVSIRRVTRPDFEGNAELTKYGAS